MSPSSAFDCATRYHVKVENSQGVCRGVAHLEVDGAAQATDDIRLVDDGARHTVFAVFAAVVTVFVTIATNQFHKWAHQDVSP